MSNQPHGTPWRGQYRVPPPPAPPSATAELPPVPARRSWWARRTPTHRALLIVGAVAALPLLFCVGGLALAALTADSPDVAGPIPAASRATAASPSPVVLKRTITETEEIPFEEVEVEDSALPEGTREVRTEGAAGERTITYEVTITDGVETGKRRLETEVTREPVDRVIAVGTKPPEPAPAPEPGPDPDDRSGCHSSYEGPCVPIGVADVDCAGGSGDGPAYVRGPVYIVGDDEYDLDRDGDGVACEDG